MTEWKSSYMSHIHVCQMKDSPMRYAKYISSLASEYGLQQDAVEGKHANETAPSRLAFGCCSKTGNT